MIETLKIIHFLCFCIGIGGGFASAVIGARTTPETAPFSRPIQKLIGRASFFALILLWITGITLLNKIYGGWTGLPTAFWWKIGAVFLLSITAITTQILVLQGGRTNTPPPAPLVAKLGMIAVLTSALALIFAVIAFTG